MKVGKIYREKMSSSIQEGVSNKGNTFVVSFRGISSAKMNVLRKDLKRKKADVVVSKTSVSRIALKEAKFETLSGRVSGQTALVLSNSDASEVSKILVKFAKDYEGFVVQGGLGFRPVERRCRGVRSPAALRLPWPPLRRCGWPFEPDRWLVGGRKVRSTTPVTAAPDRPWRACAR